MVLKFFLVLLGVLVGGSVALLMMVKQWVPAIAAAGRKPVVYGLVASVLAALVAYGLTLITDDLFTLYWILTGLFLLFGIVQVQLMHRQFVPGPDDDRVKTGLGEFLFALAVLLFTTAAFAALLYFLKDSNYLFYPMLLSGLAFFIPLMLVYSFEAALRVPDAQFVTWRYPLGAPIDPPEEKENERLLVIGFEIAKKDSDVKKTYFRARAPEDIPLGELFYHFINDYNDLHSETPIRYLAREEQPYPWWFRRKPKWYQSQRILDPGQTIKENDIRENSVIICERMAPAG